MRAKRRSWTGNLGKSQLHHGTAPLRDRNQRRGTLHGAIFGLCGARYDRERRTVGYEAMPCRGTALPGVRLGFAQAMWKAGGPREEECVIRPKTMRTERVAGERIARTTGVSAVGTGGAPAGRVGA